MRENQILAVSALNQMEKNKKIKQTADNVQVTNHKNIQLECGKKDNEP